jgi:hypothetical protein
MTTAKTTGSLHKVQLVAVTAVVLLAASCSSGQQASKLPISCVMDIRFEPDPGYWHGPIGGCSLEGGTVEFYGTPQSHIVGDIDYFYETFTINPPGGGKITGHNEGQWDTSSGKFTASGSVTDAPPAWASLVGAAFYEIGTTKAVGRDTTAFGTVMTLQ